MELKVLRENDRIVWLALVGRMDTEGASRISSQFNQQAAARNKHVAIDCSGVDFLASCGIRMLLGVAKSLGKQNLKLVVLRPQPIVEEVLRMAGLHTVLAIEHDPTHLEELLAP